MGIPAVTRAAGSAGTERTSDPAADSGLTNVVQRLPKDIGIVLLVLGAVGVVIPGPIPPGGSLILVGLFLTCPPLARRFDRWFKRRLPVLYNGLEQAVSRLEADLARRYPRSKDSR